MLLKELIDNKAKNSGILIPTNGIKPPTNRDKSMKLRSLIIPIRNGWIKFNEAEQKKLMNEMRRFPKAASDNLMDLYGWPFRNQLQMWLNSLPLVP